MVLTMATPIRAILVPVVFSVASPPTLIRHQAIVVV
jgi:hypothetical protein